MFYTHAVADKYEVAFFTRGEVGCMESKSLVMLNVIILETSVFA